MYQEPKLIKSEPKFGNIESKLATNKLNQTLNSDIYIQNYGF